MKSQLSILVLIFVIFISSCSKALDSKSNKPTSQAKPPQSRVYKINWSYCADAGQIMSADEDGCKRSKAPLYFWLKEPGIVPKAILIKRGSPFASEYVEYEVAILAQGCYPKYLISLSLDFYATQARINLHQGVAGDRQIIDDVQLEVEAISREEEKQLYDYYYNNQSSSPIPPSCRNYPTEREKLAPYFPKEFRN